jgi:hypothetical protein
MTDIDIGFPDKGVFKRMWFEEGDGSGGKRKGFADLWFPYGDEPQNDDDGHHLACQLDESGEIRWEGEDAASEWISGVVRTESVPPELWGQALRCCRDRIEGGWDIYRPQSGKPGDDDAATSSSSWEVGHRNSDEADTSACLIQRVENQIAFCREQVPHLVTLRAALLPFEDVIHTWGAGPQVKTNPNSEEPHFSCGTQCPNAPSDSVWFDIYADRIETYSTSLPGSPTEGWHDPPEEISLNGMLDYLRQLPRPFHSFVARKGR